MPRDNGQPEHAILRSFAPIVDRNSRVLVLGTMPGPEALRKREYYGFGGNHFWRITCDLLAPGRTLDYRQKIALLRRHRIALWDVLASCVREGAADSAIRAGMPTDVPGLLDRFSAIHTVFCNGQTSARLLRRFHGALIRLPVIVLPSTSPAHAAMPYAEKRAKWHLVIDRARAKAAPRPTESL